MNSQKGNRKWHWVFWIAYSLINHLIFSPERFAWQSNFFIKCDEKIERIHFDELLYVESMQNYVSLQTERGKFINLKKYVSRITDY